jgi:hypothetical protein
MMALVRIGLNILDLRRARHHLPAGFLATLDGILDGLAAEFRAQGGMEGPWPRLELPMLDAALALAACLPRGAARDDVLMGLAGVRLGLFPGALGYDPPPAPATLLARVA